MVSMFSIHFFRWTEQLKDSGHKIFWIDVFDSNTKVSTLDFVDQSIGWRNRWDFPGRYWMKNNAKLAYRFFNIFNQRKLNEIVEEKINEIRPDIVHSFILQSATFPLRNVMRKYPDIKWVYSAWGNDLFYRQRFDNDLSDIKKTLPEIDYMFADCTRDYFLAKDFGFSGQYLGTFPTGGGYELKEYSKFISKFKERKRILIKGYQGKLGRCNKVLEGIIGLKSQLKDYMITIYGANSEVYEFADRHGLLYWNNFELKYNVPHTEVLQLMGESIISIGNCISDGMPNTFLEAIIMDSFPIQSNPGGATSELISDKKNGLLINDPEESFEIGELILYAINNPVFIENAIKHNTKSIKPFLEREKIKTEVLKKYQMIENQLKDVK